MISRLRRKQQQADRRRLPCRAGDIGIDVIEGLAAALSAAEAAHNLITDEESAILFK